MKKIVFATNNAHKLSEIRDILGDSIEVLSLKDIGCDVDIPETGSTLEENALQKASYVFDRYHIDCFADDTGLEVDALGGAPGVYSARYAGEGHDSEANMQKLLHELGENNNRRARFRTVIALVEKGDHTGSEASMKTFEGIVNGDIIREKRGEGGFGYDPIFRPEGYSQSFAELGTAVKNQISHRARATAKLAKYLLLLLACFFFHTAVAATQIGTWQVYMAYHEPQQIIKAGNELYVRASNGLYTYNLDDQSITTYDKINGLSDTEIKHIAWNTNAKRLIIVYSNSNIDLMEKGGNVVNISSLFSKAMTQDKTINNVYIHEDYAYLATGFGIIKLNMKQNEITESYILNTSITAVGISGTTIYARTKDNEVMAAPLTSNLLDAKSWNATEDYPSNVFDSDNSDWNQYLETVKTLNPGGPKYNYFGFLRFKHGRLYTTGAGYSPGFDLYRPGCIQILKDGEWQIMQDNLKEITGYDYLDVDVMDVDPNDPEHVFAGARTGLYEFQDGQFVKTYNVDNSPLQSAVAPPAKDYVFVHAMCFDNNGTLWLFNCSTKGMSCLFELTKDYKWTDHYKELLTNNNKSLKGIKSAYIDSRGYLWFVNKNWEHPAFYCYDPKTDDFINYYTSIINQDGTIYADFSVTCVTEDIEGNIWIGTNKGPFMIEKNNITTFGANLTQVKVPRNDGTNYADYLLAGATITNIVIDGGGRKWFGTQGSGIYLISADNIHELEHFTTENSPLLSDNIESMAINNANGELFIGTDKGLCSYMTDATTASGNMSKDNVYAYPNPVAADYNGLITIVGLSLNADVKILSSSGKLIAEGRSNGGSFTWDGHDKSGKRVASGIYMVASATNDGKKGTVCKIAIIK